MSRVAEQVDHPLMLSTHHLEQRGTSNFSLVIGFLIFVASWGSRSKFAMALSTFRSVPASDSILTLEAVSRVATRPASL